MLDSRARAHCVISLRFRVGNQPVTNFRMIERHYFKGRLIKSFDFEFPFCIRTHLACARTVAHPVADSELRE